MDAAPDSSIVPAVQMYYIVDVEICSIVPYLRFEQEPEPRFLYKRID